MDPRVTPAGDGGSWRGRRVKSVGNRFSASSPWIGRHRFKSCGLLAPGRVRSCGLLRLVRSCELPGVAPGASPRFGAGAKPGLRGLVMLDPVDGPIPPRVPWARARPPDRSKIAIVAYS